MFKPTQEKTFSVFSALMLILALSVSLGAWAKPVDEPSFQSTYSFWRKALVNRASQLPHYASLAGVHVVLVAGFGNELIDSYFAVNKRAFEEMGASKVTVLEPLSMESAEQSIDDLRRGFELLHAIGGGKPILFVGHSRGGLISVGFMLKYPEYVEAGYVHGAVAVQSPLCSCHVGSITSGVLRAVDARTGSASERLAGVHSLSNAEIDAVIADRIGQLSPSRRALLSSRTFFVTSHQGVRKTALAIKPSAVLLNWIFDSKGDGMVAEASMVIPGFGQVLGRVIGDHLEFWIGPSLRAFLMGVSTASKRTARAFTAALADQLDKRVLAPRRVRSCRAAFTSAR